MRVLQPTPARRPPPARALLAPFASAPAWASPPSGAEHSPIATANQLGEAFSHVGRAGLAERRQHPGRGQDGRSPTSASSSRSAAVLTAMAAARRRAEGRRLRHGAHRRRRHPHQQPRGRERDAHRGRAAGRPAASPAKVVGVDPATDLAVLKIDAKGLPAVRFADSDARPGGRVGDRHRLALRPRLHGHRRRAQRQGARRHGRQRDRGLPADRRQHQPRQLGRSARQPATARCSASTP